MSFHDVPHLGEKAKRPLALLTSLLMLVAFGIGAINPSVAGAAPTTGTISGTITNPDNSPAVGATVTITDTNFDSYTATTDSTGAYTITDVPATAPGDQYSFDIVPAYPDSTTIAYDYYNNPIAPATLAAGQNLTGENSKLATAGSISGTVTSGGSPVAGVDVEVSDPTVFNVSTTGEATTDANGQYTVTGLAPTTAAHYQVTFNTSSLPAPGYAPNTYPDELTQSNATLIGATSGGTTGIDAHLVVASTVSGTVVDSAGNPISGASVSGESLDQSIGQFANATSDSNGNFTLTGLGADAMELSAAISGGAYAQGSLENPIVVPASTDVTGITIMLPDYSATATTGTAYGTVRDTGGNPIEGATVNVNSTDGGATYTATTDVNGKYSITGIAEDSYDVGVFDSPNYSHYDLASDRTGHGDQGDGSIYVSANQGYQVDATLMKNAHFSGTITDNDNNPIQAGQVNAVLINTSNDTVTQIDEVMNGTWDLYGPPGTYKIEFSSGVWHDSYVDQWWNNAATEAAATSLTVTEGQQMPNMNVVLQPTPPAATVPGTPTNVSATAGDGSATVSWSAPASDGGAAIENYWVTEYIGGVQQDIVSASGTSTTITGLTNGTTYTFTVSAHNTVGDSPASAASNPVTPVAPAAAPDAPTGVSATAGNGQASVSWSAPASDGGAAITGYTVTSTPDGKTCITSGATSCTVTGLTNGTSYTFTVTATNSAGTGAASAASNSVTPVAPTAPDAPTGVSATAGNGQASVSWTAPASDGGAAITGYTVTSNPDGKTCITSGATSCTVTGLTNGTSYTFTVTATNSVGTGGASVASNSVTPVAPANTANESFVIAAYTDFLGRAPSANEESYWAGRLNSGTPRTTLLDALANSTEWVTHIVVGFYNDTLGRVPDQAGLNYWVGQITSGKQSVARVAAQFYASGEYFRATGHSNVVTWLGDLYTKVLHRTIDPSGLNYWSGQVAKIGRGGVAYEIYQSTESGRDRVTTLYGELLHRAPDPGGLAYWTNRLTPTDGSKPVGDIELAVFLANSAEYYQLAQTRFP